MKLNFSRSADGIGNESFGTKARKVLADLCDATAAKLRIAALAVLVPTMMATGAGCGGRTGLLIDYSTDNDADNIFDADLENDGDIEEETGPGGDADVDLDVEVDSDLDEETDSDLDVDEEIGEWRSILVMEPRIGDQINRTLGDRLDNVIGDTDSEYQMGGSDTSENANPFTDGMGGNLGESQTFMHKIGCEESEGRVCRFVISDFESGNTYEQDENLWVGGSNEYDSAYDSVVGDITFVAYTSRFYGPGSNEDGILVCTEPDGTDFTTCVSEFGNLDDATATHRVEVMFLGERWVILDMTPPNVETHPLDNENGLVAGGRVFLGREVASGIISRTETEEGEVTYEDIYYNEEIFIRIEGVEAHGDGIDSVIIGIYRVGEETPLELDLVGVGETQTYTIDGEEIIFHTYHISPGYTFGMQWADVAILSQTLELESGHELNADEDDNRDWNVILGWKNRAGSILDLQADALRTIKCLGDWV